MTTTLPRLQFVFVPNPDNPAVTEWPEMPRETFGSVVKARQAARDFIARWTGGGYRPADDVWWASEQIGALIWRTTEFRILDR